MVEKKDGSEAEVAKDLLINQNKRAENELIMLREGKLGRAGSVFKIARSIQGPKKGAMEANAIIDPETGNLAVSAMEIKRVSLDHCKRVLTNNAPLVEYSKEIALKEKIHEERMSRLGEGSFNPTLRKF